MTERDVRFSRDPGSMIYVTEGCRLGFPRLEVLRGTSEKAI